MTTPDPTLKQDAETVGAFTPLRRRLFAMLWIATVVGNIGTFMRDVASAWLVTEISSSPAAVALVQAAGSLPIFLLAIPAGVLSDILDRRRFLICVQAALALVSTALAIIAVTGQVSVASLVALTFLGGAGAAMAMPTWQAITPELVPRPELRSAVALNSLGFNISRALGPALGGAILAALGAPATYVLDVATYVLVIAALWSWRRETAADDGLRERFGGALRAGLRYARASTGVRRLLGRAALFFAFASAVWALLPIIVRHQIGGGPGLYGAMLGAVGAGAIMGALLLPAVRHRLSQDRLVLGASLMTAFATALLAIAKTPAAGMAVTFLLGVAWIAILTTLNATMQGILPNWTRGRGLAVYLTVFNGAMAAGSLLWGVFAQAAGSAIALATAGAGLVLAALFAHRSELPSGDRDLTPSMHWPEPAMSEPIGNDRGPVLVTVTYRVEPADRGAFMAALARLAEERRRDGAFSWGITEDAGDPEQLVEWFFIESWAEHMRQHQRVSRHDAGLQANVQRFHRGEDPPVVRHFIAIETHAEASMPTSSAEKPA
ncbi:MFS transporter [Xanthobacteraceae bacterium Astr-EGSB]|uniref:MFS transporter n=1 Tax=Astrobacterium formosum TaxID=3069710 RepID=UPI0027B875BC|nr:MFS transporter [Xanthobacteraceae bacterium Astr-EGSB]